MKHIARPKEKPMPITKYIDTMNRLYGSDGGAVEAPEAKVVEERFNDKILKRDKYETPKKQIIKKTLIAKKELPKDYKPTYLNGNVIDMTPLLEDEWHSIFGEEPWREDSRLLLVPKSKAEGITSILNLHKKRA